MKIHKISVMKNVVFRNVSFNPDSTFGCGQVFRWENIPSGEWFGVFSNSLVRVKKISGGISAGITGPAGKDEIAGYLSLDDELDIIFSDIFKTLKRSREKYFLKALEKAYADYGGLRLISGEPFETAVSYILSRNNSIVSISRLVYFISKYLSRGKTLSLEGYTNAWEKTAQNYPFPVPADFLSSDFSRFCFECTAKLRYPASQKRELTLFAERIIREKDFFSSIINPARSRPLEFGIMLEARKKLLEILGVGNKVTDCIMLFSLNHLNAFPVDRWVLRLIEKYTANAAIKKISGRCLDRGSISDREYLSLLEYANGIFGRYCGYAGEYLFHAERMKNGLV